MAYEVEFASFQGPFDLLLSLISRDRMDICEVPLAKIVADYLDHLKEAAPVDLEISSEFFVIAASLFRLKVNRLLPSDRDEVDEGDGAGANESRADLIRRLLEYQKFKAAGEYLGVLIQAESGYYPRVADIEERFQGLLPDLSSELNADVLLDMMKALISQERVDVVDAEHIIPKPLLLDDYVKRVLGAVKKGDTTFQTLTQACDNRSERITFFLAILELVRRGHVEAVQTEPFLDIELSARDGGVSDGERNIH